MKLLIAGDWHGDSNAYHLSSNPSVEKARKARAASIISVDRAVMYGAQHIIQCGDFGLWPGRGGMVYLDRLNAALVEKGITLIWLDGNHEDFDQLDHFVANNPRNTNGQVFIRSNILYSPRGCQWAMDGKRFLTVGGAVSIDKMFRTPGKSWWPQEQLTLGQVTGIINNAMSRRERGRPEVDYMFTHDCHPVTPFRFRLKKDIDSNMHRDHLKAIANAVRPGKWFHGHMHEKYDWTLTYSAPFEPYTVEAGDSTQVYGLADGVEPNSWGILDTETDEFRFEGRAKEGLFDE